MPLAQDIPTPPFSSTDQAPSTRYRSTAPGMGSEKRNRSYRGAISFPPPGAESSERHSLGDNPSVISTHSRRLSQVALLLSCSADRDRVRDLKEKYCYVALDFEKEKMEANSPSYAQKCQLPDGQEIDLGREMFFCPEALFWPNLIGEPSCRCLS